MPKPPPKAPIAAPPKSAAAQLLRFKADQIERLGYPMEKVGTPVHVDAAITELYRHQANSLEWQLASDAVQRRHDLFLYLGAIAVLALLADLFERLLP
jgi:hypothetical protein